ncbi:MAG TPA: AsmA-like C-terminal region-containing protein [Candidatus Sulfopaludibacter sp.]|nr:AsmA-like C-terminal region-containing protein [Candidatus Sulfopaludibacter sp.]
MRASTRDSGHRIANKTGMLVEHSPSKQFSIPKWLWIGGGILLAALTAGVIFLAHNWPFTQAAVIQALEAASGRQVQVRTFSDSYFPPGCTVEGIRFLRHKHPEESPIITVERLVVRGSFTGFFSSPKRLSLVRIVGMHMVIPPKTGGAQGPVPLNSGSGRGELAISNIIADGAVLEFVRADRSEKPYILKIDRLGLRDLGPGTRMTYRAMLTNTEPPGVIHSEGKFGPWNPADMGATPVSGTYSYDDIDLSIFHGISGVGHARGKFEGPLSRIQTQGSVEVAKFQVDGSDHSVALATTYQATVNGTNGDVLLNPATARYRRTQIDVRGWIAGGDDTKGKSASFDVAVPSGRVDDLLYLFSKGAPGMSGNVSLNGKFLWPPGPQKFVEKIRMDLTFGMKASHFTSPNTQDSINRISESAQGEKKKQEDEDPRTVLSQLHGAVRLREGTATITGGTFEVPGAQATVHGTYNLLTHTVDLHGTLDTSGHLSDTTSGFKALVLKAVTPLLRKKHEERIIPFQITGSYGNTSVGIDLKKGILGSK